MSQKAPIANEVADTQAGNSTIPAAIDEATATAPADEDKNENTSAQGTTEMPTKTSTSDEKDSEIKTTVDATPDETSDTGGTTRRRSTRSKSTPSSAIAKTAADTKVLKSPAVEKPEESNSVSKSSDATSPTKQQNGTSGSITKTKSRKSRSEETRTDPIVKIGTVRNIMKLNCSRCSGESIEIVAKATELFIQHMVEESIESLQNRKRKILQYEDVSGPVHNKEEFEFLKKLLPSLD